MPALETNSGPNIAILAERMDNIRSEGVFPCGLARVQAPLDELSRRASDFLHDQERAFLARLSFPKRQHTYLLGRLAAKQALRVLDPELKPNEIWLDRGIFEYPIVRGSKPGLTVTISHAANVAFALAGREEHPLGIDAEECGGERTSAIASQLTASEIELLAELKVPVEFSHALAWTMKEALSKVLRTGMMTPFEIFALDSISAEGRHWTGLYKNFAQYKAVAFRSAGLVCSIALPRRSEARIPAAFFD